jgi:bifunctional DNA-binding transcriptional regulator/antitoxin component of YhaV-PrlF toxin-antitoxin module
MPKKKTHRKKISRYKDGRTRIDIPSDIRDDLDLKDKDPADITTIGNDRILITLLKKMEENENK